MLVKSRLIIERGSSIFPKYQKATKPPATPKTAPEAPALIIEGFHHTLARPPPRPLSRYSARKVQFPNIRSASRPRLHKHHIYNNKCTTPMCTKTEDNRRHHSPLRVCKP